jgi:hypothetical protein
LSTNPDLFLRELDFGAFEGPLMEFLEGKLHILFLCFVKILLEYRRDEYSKKSKSKKVEGVGNELLSHIVLWMSFV